ncbi:MAG: GTP 3',8-cyclase MoaA [Solirubrobacteraceae bacterium]
MSVEAAEVARAFAEDATVDGIGPADAASAAGGASAVDAVSAADAASAVDAVSAADAVSAVDAVSAAGGASDALRRPLRDLRISVTDRCNLRCSYCMPREAFGAGYRFLAHDELLSFEQIASLAAAFARNGVRKIRVTGGEPLLRRDLPQLVQRLVAVPGIQEVALTTNGWLLARHARALARAGLHRVTVSLDSLDARVLEQMGGGRGGPRRVLAGIDAATEAGLQPIKVNMVVRRNVNESCVLAMARRFRHTPQILRFIEYMDVGSTNGWSPQDVVPAAQIVAAIGRRWPLTPLAPTASGEVARRYAYADGAGEVGIISPVSEPFCGGCTRARLSADGRLHTCLFARAGHDLRALLREGVDQDELALRIGQTWARRSDRYSAERFDARTAGAARAHGQAPKPEMSYLGG